MLEIVDFHKSYPNNFHLKIEKTVLSKGPHLIQGENGAGKSTLFKAIAGIHSFEGNIILDGISVKQEPVKFRRFVNYSEAEPHYPAFLSLDDLIDFVAAAKKATTEQIHSLKAHFGVMNYSSTSIATYSSGMLKKASLLLAFLGNPKLIILDEPFTTIDKEAQENLLHLIREEMKKGKSFLISSHHLPVIQSFSFESVHHLKNGQIEQNI